EPVDPSWNILSISGDRYQSQDARVTDRAAGGAPTHQVASLPWWAHAADVAAIALIVVAVFVTAHGGFVLHPFGMRLSVRSEWRLFVWAVGLLVLRHLIVPQPPVHQSIIRRVGAAARAPGPLVDDLVFLARTPIVGGTRSVRRSGVVSIVLVIALF